MPQLTKMQSLNNREIFIPKYSDLYGRDPATLLTFYFSFFLKYVKLHILSYIFICARNNLCAVLL